MLRLIAGGSCAPKEGEKTYEIKRPETSPQLREGTKIPVQVKEYESIRRRDAGTF